MSVTPLSSVLATKNKVIILVAIGHTCVHHVVMWNNVVLSISERRTDT